ncbi:hypothetical protein Pen01_60170 [Phytomonospora endophytica]|nr:hypothetical protein Pen01_60170 [Phytomonospora endophytica]
MGCPPPLDRWLAGLRVAASHPRGCGRPFRPHPYRPDPAVPVDHRGTAYCRCGLPKSSRWHDVPNETPSDVDERHHELNRRLSGPGES